MLPPTSTGISSNQSPWFKLHDEHVSSLSVSSSSSLLHIQSIKQMEDSSNTIHTEQDSGINDDSTNIQCERHPQILAFCIFRPCSHFACQGCYDEAISNHQLCPHCDKTVSRFVGVKDPIEQTMLSKGDERAVADSGDVTIIHLPFDRVSPLYAKNIAKSTALCLYQK